MQVEPTFKHGPEGFRVLPLATVDVVSASQDLVAHGHHHGCWHGQKSFNARRTISATLTCTDPLFPAVAPLVGPRNRWPIPSIART